MRPTNYYISIWNMVMVGFYFVKTVSQYLWIKIDNFFVGEEIENKVVFMLDFHGVWSSVICFT